MLGEGEGTTPRTLTGRTTAERLILLSLIGVAAVAAAWFVTTFEFLSWDFRNNLWAPAHLLVNGMSPYDLSPMRFELGRAIWMPTVIGAFFPLGWLSQQTATNLWLLFNAVIVVAFVFQIRDKPSPAPWLVAALLLSSFLFPPTITHFSLGQVTLLTAAIFLFLAREPQRLLRWSGAFLLAVAFAKPQLLVFLLPGLLLALYAQVGLRGLFRAALLAALAALLLTIPLFIAAPSWPLDFVRSLGENPDWLQPSLLNILRFYLGPSALFLWAPLFAGFFALNLWIWRRLPPHIAVLWSMALTPLVTPYVWSWDFVLILPLFGYIALQSQNRRTLALLFGGYAICWAAAIAVTFSAPKVSNHLYWWIPWAMMGVVGLGQAVKRT